MLKYGNKEQRKVIINSFFTNVVKLMKNQTAAPILDRAYQEYASAEDKCKMLQEFCAPDFRHHKDSDCSSNFEAFLNKRPERLPEFLKNIKHEVLKIIAK